MLLRASSEFAGDDIDLTAVTAGDGKDCGVDAGAELIAFAEAATRRDASLPAAREALHQRLGAAALVDAAAVVGNFERMVRIADASGIPLDDPMRIASADLREELGIDRFAAAANTPPVGALSRWIGRGARKLAFGVLRQLGRVQNRS